MSAGTAPEARTRLSTHLRACDVPEVRQDLLRWADENVVRGQRGSGAVQVRGFTDPFLMQSAVRGAEG
ncbi:hypothetical protein [Streptomyces sp. A0592]|uniref:hypothetical protein n=1 Tax=Streptomyces TaxID=1883 RepID=UPI00109EBC45|nr:hypothetical protein [Streptomyces sp. A0592]THA79767.1 hypothetical protein E6U81_31700 [Streptomyces sp. A0592]WSR81266.1 hypothetical protein OG489_00540 [Streptomyces erythrochromogenes]WSR88262.1 hypothetical protein OG489_39420 [Streptomyces erythrochromogenes]